ncbi:MAG: acyl carrier protein [Deltaproteobacteria bacterium]|nr:acyl carrier protein [Deltaproteobacteria bacterium]
MIPPTSPAARCRKEIRLLDPLEKELSVLIMEICRVPSPPPAELSPDAPLIGPDSPFGLDSLDAVEIVVAIQKKYDIRIGSQETSRQVLQSLRTLAAFLRDRRERPGG